MVFAVAQLQKNCIEGFERGFPREPVGLLLSVFLGVQPALRYVPFVLSANGALAKLGVSKHWGEQIVCVPGMIDCYPVKVQMRSRKRECIGKQQGCPKKLPATIHEAGRNRGLKPVMS